ncbi:MAG: alanine racemase [Nocardioidaceae bacterium]
MALTLYVDGARWRDHLRVVAGDQPGIVPVAKGNGYGFGLARLATQADWLGVDTMAVGAYHELGSLFEGSVLVLTPWRPFEKAVFGDHVVHTVGRLEDLRSLAGRDDMPRIVLERATSMRRHGLTAHDLRRAAEELDGVALDGIALHLPLRSPGSAAEMQRLMTDIVAAELPTKRVYVSHLTSALLARLASSYPEFELRPRVGTELWLGDRGALRVRSTVLDSHQVERGDAFGYHGRTAPRAGTILVVSGGTAHGIGLEAPSSGSSWRDRAARIARGGLDAAGFVRSPYLIDGKHRLFAEPPHMQSSMLFLPRGVRVPEIGEEVDVRVRMTATTFDETIVS